LAIAMNERKLHRNFMGYTDVKTDTLLGLGVSSISETSEAFHQNEKVLAVYEKQVSSGEIPTHRGHILTEEDRRRKKQILQLMTEMQVAFESEKQMQDAQTFFEDMKKDGLVE